MTEIGRHARDRKNEKKDRADKNEKKCKKKTCCKYSMPWPYFKPILVGYLNAENFMAPALHPTFLQQEGGGEQILSPKGTISGFGSKVLPVECR